MKRECLPRTAVYRGKEENPFFWGSRGPREGKAACREEKIFEAERGRICRYTRGIAGGALRNFTSNRKHHDRETQTDGKKKGGGRRWALLPMRAWIRRLCTVKKDSGAPCQNRKAEKTPKRGGPPDVFRGRGLKERKKQQPWRKGNNIFGGNQKKRKGRVLCPAVSRGGQVLPPARG